jgi:hypothetical protein
MWTRIGSLGLPAEAELAGEQAVYERVGAWTATPVLADPAGPTSNRAEFKTPVQRTGPGPARAA